MTEKELMEKQLEKLNHILEMLEVIAGNTADINNKLNSIEYNTEETKEELEKLNRKVGN